ncbi:MAG: ferritin-like domain-containing protein [Polyangiales bacterium]
MSLEPPTLATLSTFTQTTTLAAEHRRLMDEHHRAVDWSRSTAATLPPALREQLADVWRERTAAEHRSVGIFNLYALDLLGAGAPAELLSLACRAALDEVRHAELFARLTRLYSSQPESPPPGIPAMPDDPTVPIRFQVAREALHLAVGSETYSAVSITELHARAIDPVVKDVLGVVLSDEIYHARMGWACLASPALVDAPLRAYLDADVVPMFDGLVRSSFGDPAAIPASPIAEEHRALAAAHGYLSLRDEYTLFCATIEQVWIPGLVALGLESARALHDRYPRGA